MLLVGDQRKPADTFYAVVGVLLSSCVAAAPTMNNSSLIIIA